jgi:diaminopimelate decarboxylase
MPMSADFQSRLEPILEAVADRFGTPFHVYDEVGIRQTIYNLTTTFRDVPHFREYYAVKTLPNPHILKIIHEAGCGFDCSSIPELVLSRGVGARGEAIMFTSNNTSPEEFAAARADGGCILNLDDINLIDKASPLPDLICFRYNPGSRRAGNAIIGKPEEAKYGLRHDQLLDAYQRAKAEGCTRFGLHTMLISNERDYRFMLETVRMLLDLAGWLEQEIGMRLEFINMGGGLGIPYQPDDQILDLAALGTETAALFKMFTQKYGYAPALHMESGRYVTGPHGVLITRAINRKDTYRTYIGVDASMSALMRPGMYGSYHHITVAGKGENPALTIVDVTGSLCENNDKFAIQRPLPPVSDGDLLIIHDTGAHGHAMGFNYNGRLRPQELLLRQDGRVERIRRAETLDDYFATLQFEADCLQPQPIQPALTAI